MGNGDRFVYVTYIRTSPEKLWDALIKPEFTRQYWFGSTQDSTWEKGATWELRAPDGRLTDSGTVVEIDRPRRLVLCGSMRSRPRCALRAIRGRPTSWNCRATW